MAHYTNISGVKVLIVLLVLGFFTYLLGPPVYWHFFGDESARIGSSCPLCVCDNGEDEVTRSALKELQNVTIPDCPSNDPDMNDELAKSRFQKLQEEMKLQESVNKEAQERLRSSYLEMKKTSSQYQKEFEKCNSGMESSEGAREKAQALLAREKKTSAMWEARAKELGWKDEDKSEGDKQEEDRPEEEKSDEDKTEEAKEEKLEEQESTEDVPEDMPGARKPKNDHRNVQMTKKNQKVVEEFHQNLAMAHYILQRAVDNEMSGLREARKNARELNLL